MLSPPYLYTPGIECQPLSSPLFKGKKLLKFVQLTRHGHIWAGLHIAPWPGVIVSKSAPAPEQWG